MIDTGEHRQQHHQHNDRPPVPRRERRPFDVVAFNANGLRRIMAAPAKIDGKTQHHANAGGDEPQMPVHALPQCAADERRDDHGQLDAEKIDLEAVRPARIVDPVERADLACDIRLEAADAGEEQHECDQESGIHRQQKRADHHDDGADADGGGAPEQAIGDETAGQGCQVNQRRIELRRVRGERHLRLRAVHKADEAAKGAEAPHVFDMSGLQQVMREIQHQQRLHAVIGKTLPELGSREPRQTHRMAEECPVASVSALRCYCRAVAHLCPHPLGIAALSRSRRPFARWWFLPPGARLRSGGGLGRLRDAGRISTHLPPVLKGWLSLRNAEMLTPPNVLGIRSWYEVI